MSIPPLVCSSPPPPEQCEDDKEPEDYDFQYNSQPDDDEDSASYNYVNFSSNTIYKTQTESIQDLKLSENLNVEIENIPPSSPGSEPKMNSSVPPLSDDSEKNSYLQEDCVLEDLNLELTTESLHMHTDDKSAEIPKLNENDSSVLHIQDAGGTDDDIENVQIKSLSQEPSENYDLNALDNSSGDISFNDNDDIKKLDEVLPIDVKDEIEKINEEIKATASQFVVNKVDPVDEDDFGDFDSFQFTDTKTQSESILNVENPWDSNTDAEGFGDFTANFDNSEPIAAEVTEEEISEESATKNISENLGSYDDNNDDDFGDFDDFKSSEKADTAIAPDVMPHSSVLDFPTSDNEVQIMENINKVLATIFPEEVSEPSEMLEANIDKSLGEIWGHLVDTDIRQPYMVSWNNTLGQKSLLKALCIDSRNILFGTRWNYNMPKFAANLSASPLQPQKPVQSNPESSEQPADKESTWVDPFTPHGQESCSPESEVPAAEVKPNVLDGFTSELPATSSKIYSSSLSVQPIRQISLPDTHIFTPTDSETPRSKTIHYDNTTLGVGFDAEIVNQKLETTHITSPEKDEYWDFQHFKGAASAVPNDESKNTPEAPKDSSEKTFGTAILQPIKMEPIMPTLNWPDPGEVKETFMDFSDFISSTTVSSNPQDLKPSDNKVPVQRVDDKVQKDEAIVENDDDFETFQSAPPANHSIGFANIPETSSQISSLELPTRLESRTDANSKPSEISSSIDSAFRSETNHKSFSPQILAPVPAQVSSLPVLQPSPVNRSQQSSGQILQPLSLEGFSQINWPNPGIDLHDLSKFNPIESVHSLKSDSSSSQSKLSTPVHSRSEPDDDWGDFVSSAPKPATPKKTATFSDDDEWTDFVSSTSVKPNGLNTISFNVQSNLNHQKSNHVKYPKSNQISLDIPTLNYITPKAAGRGYADKHFQNL
ncbi:probable GPI-anchored adhesin-like protein PGA55 isoform X2 [Aricia agestis]|uniref:probable GPI-anchored adhesin-like protein PGA55 isoform X2 n=1 Tax=Aricia agestis TaxID=91739 RepID=UPI001C2028E0|nr:probable GPI-anchored adhesin-like protein PGA55 isoform X2 [Aricia agestis]